MSKYNVCGLTPLHEHCFGGLKSLSYQCGNNRDTKKPVLNCRDTDLDKFKDIGLSLVMSSKNRRRSQAETAEALDIVASLVSQTSVKRVEGVVRLNKTQFTAQHRVWGYNKDRIKLLRERAVADCSVHKEDKGSQMVVAVRKPTGIQGVAEVSNARSAAMSCRQMSSTQRMRTYILKGQKLQPGRSEFSNVDGGTRFKDAGLHDEDLYK